ncbi:MAG: Gfo/Idh/MocA family oxidoreductase [Sedimentisphaerales bacterium]|nr:Gfo/Idh/MocA family oxidoreductase [Sedimentisphaerales bacterium]
MENMKVTKRQNKNISRRDFLGTAAATAAFTIVPRHVLGGNGNTPPSEKLNIAGIGVGGMGGNNLKACEGENIVALCDVDDNYAAEVYKRYPNARKWRDFRKMLDEQKDIDAVIVATPDHTHAVIAMAAMQRGKHVYCQKPLTRTVWEARMLAEAARKYKVATQMGNQGHSGEGVRLICEWIWDGAIGDVREVHAWTNRPIWPQGIDRPTDTPPVPNTLDWDLWLGPAPNRPYHPCYLPRYWRGWWDFGCGALGDMACHVIDPAFWALKLRYPISIEACAAMQTQAAAGNQYGQRKANKETFPIASIVRYEFPARGNMPKVLLHWYDGGLKPPRPDALEAGRNLEQAESNVLLIGEKGVLRYGEYGESPRLIPEKLMEEYKRPPKTIPRVDTSHEQDWITACKGGRAACSNFDYSGPLTEAVLIGNPAVRYLGEKLLWDGENMKVTNNEEANAFVKPEFREGWSL